MVKGCLMGSKTFVNKFPFTKYTIKYLILLLISLVIPTTTTYHIISQFPAFTGFISQYHKSKLQVDRDPQIAVTGNEIDFFPCMSNTNLEKSISTCS